MHTMPRSARTIAPASRRLQKTILYTVIFSNRNQSYYSNRPPIVPQAEQPPYLSPDSESVVTAAVSPTPEEPLPVVVRARGAVASTYLQEQEMSHFRISRRLFRTILFLQLTSKLHNSQRSCFGAVFRQLCLLSHSKNSETGFGIVGKKTIPEQLRLGYRRVSDEEEVDVSSQARSIVEDLLEAAQKET